jgi:HD domain
VNPPFATADATGSDLLASFLRLLASTRPDADTALITKGYNTAAYWHQGQSRKSGDPYITHPVAVASVLAGIGADDATLSAALLHDVVCDSPCTLAALRSEFGAQIADLVSGTMAVLAGGQLAAEGSDGAAAAAVRDKRVLLIKVADRLHNMRTVRHLPRAKQVQKSAETLEVLVPMARTLRLDAITSELESLASTTLQHHGQRPGTGSGHVLAATAALLPASARARWREEWLGELHMLATRRARVTFAAQIVLGIGRLVVTLYRPGLAIKRVYRAVAAAAVTASSLMLGGWKAVVVVTGAAVAVLAALTWVLHSDDRTRRVVQLIVALRNTPHGRPEPRDQGHPTR